MQNLLILKVDTSFDTRIIVSGIAKSLFNEEIVANGLIY